VLNKWVDFRRSGDLTPLGRQSSSSQLQGSPYQRGFRSTETGNVHQLVIGDYRFFIEQLHQVLGDGVHRPFLVTASNKNSQQFLVAEGFRSAQDHPLPRPVAHRHFLDSLFSRLSNKVFHTHLRQRRCRFA